MDISVFFFPAFWWIASGECFLVIVKLLLEVGAKKQHSYGKFVEVLSESNNSTESNLLTKALFNLIVVAVSVIAALFGVDVWLVSHHGDTAGVFGDFFGGVLNPILTFLTFLGLIITIVVQRHDLRASRLEYEKTNQALTTQSVENTFFNTLDLHNKIAENIKFDLSTLGGQAYREKMSFMMKYIKSLNPKHDADTESFLSNATHEHEIPPPIPIGPATIVEGRAAFHEILKYLSSDSASPEQVMKRYMVIQEEHNHIVGHYFRNLYQVLKMIDRYDESVVSAESKNKYASILRAQLSTKELALLFINCLDNVCDKGQFKNYLIKYQMFEHLHCKELKFTRGLFMLGGDTGIPVDRSMILQYRKVKSFAPLDLEKVYGGAFGKNRGIPYDLSRRDYKPDD